MKGAWILAAVAAAGATAAAVAVSGTSRETLAATAPVPGPIVPPPGVRIVIEKELMVTDLSVVEDPARTTWQGFPTPSPITTLAAAPGAIVPFPRPNAAWTFGRLIQQMCGANDPSTFVLNWLASWEQAQTINGFTAPARPRIRDLVTDPWLARSGRTGKLDMTKAPFRLLAIVDRLDLRKNPVYGPGNAGEGRFVFGVLDQFGNPLAFTVIFEYGLPAANTGDVKAWAERWHALGALPFGPTYNAALQAVTDRFAGRNADPTKPNGSALNQIRTNEIALAGPWELREFRIASRGGLLVPVTVKQNPDASFNGTPELANWINANEALILAGRHKVPDAWLGASAPVNFVWNASGIRNPDARHGFALNTCNGCHQAETGTGFLQVGTRPLGQKAPLAGFLTGITVNDPVTGQPRTFNDLARRARDLSNVLSTSRTALMFEAPAARTTH